LGFVWLTRLAVRMVPRRWRDGSVGADRGGVRGPRQGAGNRGRVRGTGTGAGNRDGRGTRARGGEGRYLKMGTMR